MIDFIASVLLFITLSLVILLFYTVVKIRKDNRILSAYEKQSMFKEAVKYIQDENNRKSVYDGAIQDLKEVNGLPMTENGNIKLTEVEEQVNKK